MKAIEKAMKKQEKRTKVQEIIWQITKEIMPVIKKYNLKYFMLGGTLLGAIRHGGFIPWDDDIDIGMPREDYDKFLEIIPKELPSYLELHTYWDESDHHYYFSRIVDTRYELKRTGSIIERKEAVWVDVFPLDGMSNNAFVRRIDMMYLLYARARYHMATFDRVNLKRPDRPLLERIIIKIVIFTGIGTRSDAKYWLDKIDVLLRKYPVENSAWVVNFMGQYKFKEMFPKEWYGNGTSYEFEDSELIGPDNYEAVLTQQYGDYMIPPKNKNVHAAEMVKNYEKN